MKNDILQYYLFLHYYFILSFAFNTYVVYFSYV
jgi:hypothetical protein